MKIWHEFRFEASHAPAGARPHGHSFRVRVTVSGRPDARTGVVLDYDRLAALLEPLRRRLDHADLNADVGLANPTCERIAAYAWRFARAAVPGATAVEVWDTDHSGCACGAEDDAAPAGRKAAA